MALEIAENFLFNRMLQHHQHETEVGPDSHFLLTDENFPVHARALEVNAIALPAIIDAEFVRQVARQFLGGGLRGLAAHFVKSMNVDGGHLFFFPTTLAEVYTARTGARQSCCLKRVVHPAPACTYNVRSQLTASAW
jgi:hypothetical protein